MAEQIENSDYFREVELAFAGLLARGLFSVKTRSTEPRAFGNSYVILAGKSVDLKLVRDRGISDVDARPALRKSPGLEEIPRARGAPDDWIALSHVLNAVGVEPEIPFRVMTPAEAASLLETNWELIEVGLSSARIEETMRRVEVQRAFHKQRMLERWEQERRKCDSS